VLLVLEAENKKASACFSLPLALLVLRVLTDDANHAAAVDHLALVTNLLD
jgi:hypothetical protein